METNRLLRLPITRNSRWRRDASLLWHFLPFHLSSLEETIDHIIHKIYTENKLPKLGSKMLFKRLLLKVTKGTVFSFNNHLYKQVDQWGMGNSLSPVPANIFMSKLEDDIVTPNAPAFYHRYVDDCITKRKKDQSDELLEQLKSYHTSIKFTVEDNPSLFLDTQFQYKNGKFERSVYKNLERSPHTGARRYQPNGKEMQ